MAGIVAGTEAGVASGATLYALRVTDCEGRGRPEAVIAAMNWLSKHARSPAVAVLSVQYRGVEAVGHAAARLVEQGVVTVAAAGGSLENACEHMPSGTPGVITVAGTTPEDHALAHSNWGPCVDVWAPGSNIHSLPAKGDKLIPKSGSSAAAAYVAGAAAIYLAKHPQAEPAAVRTAIQKAATPARVSMQRSKFAQATRRDLLFIPPSWYE